ncbi:MAG: hypothetical protein ACYSSP_08420 [Planctomycetota bacterium]|jgi:hypothetical protein
MELKRYKNAIRLSMFNILLVVLYLFSVFDTFKIQNFLKEGGSFSDILLPLIVVLLFFSYFTWLFIKTARTYPLFLKFFALSMFFGFIGEMSMGLDGKIETAINGDYLEYLIMTYTYLVLGTIAFYLNQATKNKRLYYLAIFIIGVLLIEILFLRNWPIILNPVFTILSASFYWALSIYPAYFTNPNIAWNLKRKRLILVSSAAFISFFIIAPVIIYGFGVRLPEMVDYGVDFLPVHILILGIGVIFYALLFFADFLPDMIKKSYFSKISNTIQKAANVLD